MTKEKGLRRYTTLPALNYLLREKKLSLIDPEGWDDENDRHFLLKYRERRKAGSVVAACFTQANERYHHWRVFAGGESGVCVRFRKQPLLESLKGITGIRKGPVKYLAIADLRDRRIKVAQLPFSKRMPFRDEQEYRIIYESPQPGLRTFDHSISLDVIERVILSPWIPKSISQQLKDTLRSIEGCERLKIDRSTMIQNEAYMLAADRAVE